MITVFTPTYNRAHLLPRLRESLLRQTCMDFEWLVVDDGSTDNTSSLFQTWLSEPSPFPIRFKRVPNGGKQRAINMAVQLAEGDVFFIVDSDDMLLPDAIDSYLHAFASLPADDSSFIGVSFVKGGVQGNPLGGESHIDPKIGYVDADNLQRPALGLSCDMAEAFYTERLKAYPFEVWPGETFTPEAVVWDRMAMDGYRLRWYDKVVYLCEYQQGGLSDSTWRLLKRNPMGYAMLFDTQQRHARGIKNQVNLSLQKISCCCLAGEMPWLFKSAHPLMAALLLPFGWMLSLRRRVQLRQKADRR